jgi:hypothetical protein
MVRDQVSMEGVAKRSAVVLPAPLGQAQSDVQGCRVETASSSCVKAQGAYDELNCIDGEDLLVAVRVYSSSFWDEFHVNNSR